MFKKLGSQEKMRNQIVLYRESKNLIIGPNYLIY
jgi:hypothetical protein